jgi:Endoplasmic Reticulum Oxidoreductin 1 (ERO1)
MKDRPSFANANLFMAASPISTNPDLLPGIAAIDAQNHGFYEHLHELRDKPFFRLYSVDMLASCEYMPQQLFECYSETCEIYPVDDDDVSDLMAIFCSQDNIDE